MSFTGARLARYLADLALFHGLPDEIILDNGPEGTSRTTPARRSPAGASTKTQGARIQRFLYPHADRANSVGQDQRGPFFRNCSDTMLATMSGCR